MTCCYISVLAVCVYSLKNLECTRQVFFINKVTHEIDTVVNSEKPVKRQEHLVNKLYSSKDHRFMKK